MELGLVRNWTLYLTFCVVSVPRGIAALIGENELVLRVLKIEFHLR